MSESRYFFTNDKTPYVYDEVAALIFAGEVLSDSLIWKEGTTDWIKIKKCADFEAVFVAYDEVAKEAIDKALGQDSASIERREMRAFLDKTDEEHVSFGSTTSSWKSRISSVTILLLVLLGSVGTLWIYTTFKRSQSQSQQHTVDLHKKEQINLKNTRLASGVIKLDSITKITLIKIKKSVENTILREALIAERKQKLSTQPEKKKQAKKRGLFDKVSDKELAAFRQQLLTKGKRQPSRKIKSRGKSALSGERLTTKQIAATQKRFSGTIRSCYNKSLKNDPHLGGRMEVTLHILGNGKVAKVVNNTPKFRGGTMDRCVRSTIKKTWRFPSFNGTLTTVTLPFILSRSY